MRKASFFRCEGTERESRTIQAGVGGTHITLQPFFHPYSWHDRTGFDMRMSDTRSKCEDDTLRHVNGEERDKFETFAEQNS